MSDKNAQTLSNKIVIVISCNVFEHKAKGTEQVPAEAGSNKEYKKMV